jgi:uncharacterized protein (TIGR03437 family)
VNADDGLLNAPQSPVKPGSTLTVYLTGAGASGTTTLPWSVSIGKSPAEKVSLKASPALVGIYQAAIVVPPGTATGEFSITLTVKGVTSREATVSVGN